jgi:hypothetical protein
MQADAEAGRPFSDIVVEFNRNYRPETPLKVLAGQHRSRAILDATRANQQKDRPHGLRIYLDISRDQRAEISLISNTNIAIAKALIDRFGEQQLGSESRTWCQSVGLLSTEQDFADRISGTERLTVQIMRAFVVNYFRGRAFNGRIMSDVDNSLHESVYIPPAGALEPDPKYKEPLDQEPNLWEDQALREAGQQFANLNQAQTQACSNAEDKDLRQVGFRYKVLTPTVAAAWDYVAGVLQRDAERLCNHYTLYSNYDRNRSEGPLNAKTMSRTRHLTFDPPTYRGLGTRQNTSEAQRLVEVFLLQSKSDLRGSITQ